MPRGGKRTPQSPAPVSGPGALSARTDGGAGQPIRVAPGGAYGTAQASAEQQAAAPMADATESPGGGDASVARFRPPAPSGAPPSAGVFGPTERPHESPLAGAATRGNAVAGDVNGFLNQLYAQFPHPAIARLIDKR